MSKDLARPALPTAWDARLARLGLWLTAFTLFALPLFFLIETQDQFELPKQMLLRACTSLMLGVFLASLLSQGGTPWRRTPLDWPVLAWAAWLLVTTLHSVSPAISWRGEYENFAGSLTQLDYVVVYFLCAQWAGDPAKARLLLRALMGGVVGAALYAILQSLQRDLVGWATASVVADRFFGPMGNPNFLGGLMAMALPLKLALALDEGAKPQPRDPDSLFRWAALILWVLAYAAAGKAGLLDPFTARPGASLASALVLGLWLASLAAAPALKAAGRPRLGFWLAQAADSLLFFQTLALTGTRGAFLGLICGLAVVSLGWLSRRPGAAGRLRGFAWRAALALGLLLLVLGAALAGLGPSFRERTFASIKDPGHALEVSRLQIWVPALKIWKAYPAAGSGVDTFKTVFPAFSRSRFASYDGENVSSRMAHCEPLQVLATMGAVGLALWLWLCGAGFLAWWRSLVKAEDAGDAALLLGLGALIAAYLGQNLVSFGVAGISVPFWASLALLGCAAAPQILSLSLPKLGLAPALLLGLALALGGLALDRQTLVADVSYAFANQANAQLPLLEKAGTEELRGACYYALNELGALPAPLPKDIDDEAVRWRETLAQSESQLQSDPAAAERLKPGYQRAAGALLMAAAAAKLEDAVSRCPGEVKYQVYLGLCYEEIFRRTFDDRRKTWFEKSDRSYHRGSALNPLNAYYHGNMGRLWGLGAEAGNADFYAPAAAHYMDAVELAPVTRLFYENLLLLQARYARIQDAGIVLDKVEATDKELAPSLLIAGASTFFQWRRSGLPAWTAEAQKQALAAARGWGQRALALAPGNADYMLTQAVFEDASGDKAAAKRYCQQALQLKPGFPEAQRYLSSQHF